MSLKVTFFTPASSAAAGEGWRSEVVATVPRRPPLGAACESMVRGGGGRQGALRQVRRAAGTSSAERATAG